MRGYDVSIDSVTFFRTSRRTMSPFASTTTYPIDIWLNKGAIVLEPNYRGSAGYGEKFRSLNVRNLGIGDAWDVLSGIDALVARAYRLGVRGTITPTPQYPIALPVARPS